MGAAAPTMTVTSQLDGRHIGDIAPVWEYVLNGLWDSDDTADGTHAITKEGILKTIIFKVPSVSSTITFQVVIKDNSDNTIFDSGEKAPNATYVYDVDLPLSGTTDVVVGPSSGSGTTPTNVVVTLRGI